MANDFYCNQKFWWLTVDLAKFQSFSCCAAAPSKIPIRWLRDNPGQIFNTPDLQQERKMMLDNQPVKSCETSCWIPESLNQQSRRLDQHGKERTHTDISSQPRILNILVDRNCNMTCAYCCKQYSTAWVRDIENNGSYFDDVDERYRLSTQDRISIKIGQKDLTDSHVQEFLISEIDKLCATSAIDEIFISGGEPLLMLNLANLVSALSRHDIPIQILSGLGVDENRFKKEITRLADIPNVYMGISAESTGALYEFVRYGNTWKRFQNNINTIEELGLHYQFNSVISNLTLPGMNKFLTWLANRKCTYTICSEPPFLSPGHLDDDTKKLILSEMHNWPQNLVKLVQKDFSTEWLPEQKIKLSAFLKEFSQRRGLSLDVLPRSFVQWMTNVV